jgi:hypothetical protein
MAGPNINYSPDDRNRDVAFDKIIAAKSKLDKDWDRFKNYVESNPKLRIEASGFVDSEAIVIGSELRKGELELLRSYRELSPEMRLQAEHLIDRLKWRLDNEMCAMIYAEAVFMYQNALNPEDARHEVEPLLKRILQLRSVWLEDSRELFDAWVAKQSTNLFEIYDDDFSLSKSKTTGRSISDIPQGAHKGCGLLIGVPLALSSLPAAIQLFY